MTCCADSPPDVGTTHRVTQVFETFDDPPVLFDPAVVTLLVKDPQGTQTQVTGVRASLGNFYAEFVVPLAGQWRYRWVTEDAIRVYEGSFVVRRSEFTLYDPPGGPNQLTWAEFDPMTWTTWDALEWGDY